MVSLQSLYLGQQALDGICESGSSSITTPHCAAWQVETTEHEMIPRQVGVSGAVRKSASCRQEYWPAIGKSNRLIYYCTQTENINHWELCIVNDVFRKGGHSP